MGLSRVLSDRSACTPGTEVSALGRSIAPRAWPGRTRDRRLPDREIACARSILGDLSPCRTSIVVRHVLRSVHLATWRGALEARTRSRPGIPLHAGSTQPAE